MQATRLKEIKPRMKTGNLISEVISNKKIDKLLKLTDFFSDRIDK